MNKKTKFPTTWDELIVTINKSYIFTIIVEGDDEEIIFRNLDLQKTEVMQAGGRENIIKILENIDKINNINNVMFLMDKDTWINHGIPSIYEKDFIKTTYGYSIENDLFLDLSLDKLLDEDYKEKFLEDVKIFLVHYCDGLCEIPESVLNPTKISDHPDKVFKKKEQLIHRLTQGDFAKDIHDEIFRNYKTHLRGKSLIDILLSNLYEQRSKEKYNADTFIRIYSASKGPLYYRIYNFFADRHKNFLEKSALPK